MDQTPRRVKMKREQLLLPKHKDNNLALFHWNYFTWISHSRLFHVSMGPWQKPSDALMLSTDNNSVGTMDILLEESDSVAHETSGDSGWDAESSPCQVALRKNCGVIKRLRFTNQRNKNFWRTDASSELKLKRQNTPLAVAPSTTDQKTHDQRNWDHANCKLQQCDGSFGVYVQHPFRTK